MGQVSRLAASTTVLLAAILVVGAGDAKANTISIYTDFVASGCCVGPPDGVGMPYSNLAGTYSSPELLFFSDNGGNWHPFGLASFAADITGSLAVVANGAYTFGLFSDDGSHLLIDGSLVVDDGGTHPPTLVNGTVFLTAGIHPFEVQFYECCDGPSGVDILLPQGVTAVPEPASIVLLGTGVVGLIARRKRTTV